MVLNWELSDDHLDQSELGAKFEFLSVDINDGEESSEMAEGIEEMVGWASESASDDDPVPPTWPTVPLDGGTGGAGPDSSDVANEEVDVRSPEEFTGEIEPPPRVRRTYEEDVEIYPGRREVWQIPRPSLFQNTTDREFYALYFPIDVYPLKEQKRYNRIEFGIQFDEDADVDAVDLCPQDVFGTEEVTRTYRLAPTLTFNEVEVSAGDAEWQMSYTKLHPRITIFGAGKPKFGWVYLKARDDSVPPGSRRNWILLNVPTGLKTVTGTYYSDIVYEERKLGVYWKKPAKATDREFTIDLDSSNTLSDRWWKTTGK